MSYQERAITGSGDARPALPARMMLHETRVWALLMLGVSYWANLLRADSVGGSVSLSAVADTIINEGAFDLLAWFVIFENARSLSKRRPASRLEILQTLLVGAICVVPTRQAVAAGMLCFAMFLYAGRDNPSSARRILSVLCAISFEIIWTSPYLDFLHIAVGKLDARIVTAIYRGFGIPAHANGNVIYNGIDDFGIMLITKCSSSFMLAGTGVAFLVTALFRGRTVGRSGTIWLCGCLMMSVILTEVRLALMARNEAAYDWWHNGPGASVYSLAATASAVCFSIAATRKRTPSKDVEAGRAVA
jgi:hypothetical protein